MTTPCPNCSEPIEGHEKLRYVNAQHLAITVDSVTFTELYEGN